MFSEKCSIEVLTGIPILIGIAIFFFIFLYPNRRTLNEIWKDSLSWKYFGTRDLFSYSHFEEHEAMLPSKTFGVIAIILIIAEYYFFETCGINKTISDFFSRIFG